jgi:hypothetical protein
MYNLICGERKHKGKVVSLCAMENLALYGGKRSASCLLILLLAKMAGTNQTGGWVSSEVVYVGKWSASYLLTLPMGETAGTNCIWDWVSSEVLYGGEWSVSHLLTLPLVKNAGAN